MRRRFGRGAHGEGDGDGQGASGHTSATQVMDEPRTTSPAPADARGTTRTTTGDERWTTRTASGDARTDRATAGGVGTSTMREIRSRQRERHGGLNWGAAFFGWLVAVGLAALLTGILAAAGAAIGLTRDTTGVSASSADTLSIGGAIALLAVLAIAYYCGGYVAGRMSRFDGARQGLGAWLVGLIAMVALAILAVVAGSEYNVIEQVNLPRLPIDSQQFVSGGLIATVAALLVTALAAVLGGKAGERYHRRIDRTAVVD